MNKKIICYGLLSGLFGVIPPALGDDDVLACIEKTSKPFTTILGFGDSITAGVPYVSTSWSGNGCRCATDSSCCAGYEPTLEALLQRSYPNTVVVNWGVPGETTGDGLSRLSSALWASRPSHVLLMEGTNDLWWVDPATVVTNLQSMAQLVIAAGALPILGTLTPDTRTGSDAKPIAATNLLINNIVKTNSYIISFQDQVLSASWSSLTYDGLHPNSTGYAYMAQTWYNTLMYGH
ncbi:MAG: hypothetical protein BWK76_16540 [Desulfobulbaceae bacterium A2]|nr:MAG: hypothetical protein BWK76_16540 [Desulfobulbaceae bacterium A2]